MKKTIVGIMTIVAMLVAILGTNVNAATVGANPDAVKTGDQLDVTVTANNDIKLAQFEIVYNPEFVKPVINGEDVTMSVGKGLETYGASKVAEGRVRVSAFGNSGNNINVKFEALKDTEGAVFSIENASFSEDGRNPSSETVTNTTSVKIGEKEEDPDTTVTPDPDATTTPDPETTATPDPETTKKPDGLKYPQTGAPVYAYVAGIALVAIVAGAVVAVRKNK